MREYRRLRASITLFVTACFLGGLLSLLHPQREVFPFYSWFLFALVPNAAPQYGLLLHEVNGKALEPPRLFQAADGLVNQPHSVAVFKIVQQFGLDCERGKPDANGCRSLLEKNSLPPATKYDVVKISGDPIARWRTGSYQVISNLVSFESNSNRP